MPRFVLQTFTERKFLTSPQAIESGFVPIKASGLNTVELANTSADNVGIELDTAVSRTMCNIWR